MLQREDTTNRRGERPEPVGAEAWGRPPYIWACDGLTITQQTSATGTAGPQEGPYHTQHSVSAAVAGEQLEHALGSGWGLTASECSCQGVLSGSWPEACMMHTWQRGMVTD